MRQTGDLSVGNSGRTLPTPHPFALSLSKGSHSHGNTSFDKLRTSGIPELSQVGRVTTQYCSLIENRCILSLPLIPMAGICVHLCHLRMSSQAI